MSGDLVKVAKEWWTSLCTHKQTVKYIDIKAKKEGTPKCVLNLNTPFTLALVR